MNIIYDGEGIGNDFGKDERRERRVELDDAERVAIMGERARVFALIFCSSILYITFS